MALVGCGNRMENGKDSIILQTPVIETVVGTEEQDTGEEAYWKNICCQYQRA